MQKFFKSMEHLGIYSPNTTKLAQWYMNLLGLELLLKIEKKPDSKSVYFLSSNGMIVEILPAKNVSTIGRNLGDTSISHIGITVNNFDKTKEYLEEKGIILNNVRETSVGWKIGYFKDLDGNNIEVIYRPDQPF